MSERLTRKKERQEILKDVIRELHAGKSVDEVKDRFAALLSDVGAAEIAEIEQALISEGLSENEVKRLCDVHVAVFRESLDRQPSPESLPGHPIHTFRAENAAAARVLDQLEEDIEALTANPTSVQLQQARTQLERLREYDVHYLRKENVLFPYLERHGFTGPSSVMWAIHDDIRDMWKELDQVLAEGPGDDRAAFSTRVNELFEPMATAIREMFYKEENILFPTALEKLDTQEWREVRAQEAELGYAYVEPGDAWSPEEEVPPAPPQEQVAGIEREQELELGAGALSPQQAKLVFDHLPVEVTFVDEHDRVRFFTQTEEQLFPRSPAIIGRQVQKCHPPASVHRVQRILDDFRAGERDVAEFWIQMQGRFIHIRYFAIRDDEDTYRGTMEIVQDVTHIRELEGERRLLDEGE